VKGVNTKAYPSSTSILGGRKVIKANNNTPSILGTNMAANSLPEPKTLARLFMLMISGFIAMWLIRRKKAELSLIGCSKKVTLIIL